LQAGEGPKTMGGPSLKKKKGGSHPARGKVGFAKSPGRTVLDTRGRRGQRRKKRLCCEKKKGGWGGGEKVVCQGPGKKKTNN